MDHYSIDLLVRERIGDMQREAQHARLARSKAQRKESEPRVSITGLRKVVARIAFAG